jgi:hypothetical protein
LLGNGSVKIPLSFLGNGSVKAALLLLGNGSVRYPGNEYTSNSSIVERVVFNVARVISTKVRDQLFPELVII